VTVFISWSGPVSRSFGSALHDWLPEVLQSVSPWMSAHDIDSGTRWTNEVAKTLDQSNDAIVVLTPDNLKAPWLNFEAGALAKSVEQSRVRPICFDVHKSQVEGPLAMFQMLDAVEADFLKLVLSVNQNAGVNKLPDERVTRAFERTWPELDRNLTRIKADTVATAAPVVQRSQKDLLEEILERVRLAEASALIRSRVPGSLSFNEFDQKAIAFIVGNPGYRPGASVETRKYGPGQIVELSKRDGGLALVVELPEGRTVSYRLGKELAPPDGIVAVPPDEPPF